MIEYWDDYLKAFAFIVVVVAVATCVGWHLWGDIVPIWLLLTYAVVVEVIGMIVAYIIYQFS